MKLLNFEVWFCIYLTNTKKGFFKVKKNITDFYAFFMGCSFQSVGKIRLVILD